MAGCFKKENFIIMKTNNTPNRWLVVVGAILIQLALGALYAWSVFTKILTDPNGLYQFTATQTAWIFSAGLATFAGVMVLAGKWQAKTGPRLMTVMGGLLLGLGFVLGGFFGTSFWAQFICIGLIAGAGIGLGYVVPIAVGMRWFLAGTSGTIRIDVISGDAGFTSPLANSSVQHHSGDRPTPLPARMADLTM